MAALRVQRPSPESDTRPSKLLSPGSLRSAERRGLGIDGVGALAHVGGAEHAQPLRVGSHDPVLDAVVNHLHEMAGAVGAAMEIPLLRGAADLVTARGAIDVARTGSEASKDGIEVLHHVGLATD